MLNSDKDALWSVSGMPKCVATCTLAPDVSMMQYFCVNRMW